jgi:hypothetical protein
LARNEDNNVTYKKLELHLPPKALSHPHVRRIKACGGTYGDTRGNVSIRFVHLPATEIDLINDLVRKQAYPFTRQITMVARGIDGDIPTWIVVQHVDPHSHEAPIAQFQRKFNAALRRAQLRGLIKQEKQGRKMKFGDLTDAEIIKSHTPEGD